MKKGITLMIIASLFCGCGDNVTEVDGYGRIMNLKNLDAIKKESLEYKEQLFGNMDRVLKLGKDTSIGSQYYKIRLYPGLSLDEISKIEKDHSFIIPKIYKLFLNQINGAFIKDIALYGFPGTWMQNGKLNRDELEALNLFTANSAWKYEHSIDTSYFLIGGASFDSTENKYYLVKSDSIYCSRENGTVINRWATLNEMLKDELNLQK